MAIKEQDFTCMNGSMVIRGKHFYDDAKTESQIPIIISHGFTSDMTGTIPYAKFLAGIGCHAYVFDFCGGGYNTISDGSFHDYMTPMTEVDDLKLVVEYVVEQGNINKDKLILMGCSQGGFVSALAAAGLQKRVYGLVLFYPAFCIPDDARAGRMQTIRFDPNDIPPRIGEGKMRVSGAYASSVIKMNVFEDISRYHGNVLIVHGTGDAIVNYGYALVADDVYRKRDANCSLHLIENAPHGFRNLYFSHACKILRDWLVSL